CARSNWDNWFFDVW
nr:immunoglobulin heavy chain junction region [Mus musculus]MBK4185997.1 immunoglobulin heavy chain junction region [Mus musculus]